MGIIAILTGTFIAGFVVGVLFARKNRNTVETLTKLAKNAKR